MKWRVITASEDEAHRPIGVNIAQWNMAVDDAIYQAVHMGFSPPTIRFYDWPGGAVTIGVSSPSERVNTSACDTFGVPYVRRPTGGKTVCHHPGDLTYSVVAPNSLFDPDFEQEYLQFSWISIA